MVGKRFRIINIVWLWTNLGNWTVFSVIGAIVIIVGLYTFLWGKNQDQPLKSGAEKVVPTAPNTATADERMTTSNQEFMAINMTSTKSTDGTAWK